MHTHAQAHTETRNGMEFLHMLFSSFFIIILHFLFNIHIYPGIAYFSRPSSNRDSESS